MHHFPSLPIMICCFAAAMACGSAEAKTTHFSLGDTIVWSISGVSDSEIYCESIVQDAGDQVERIMCSAPLKIGASVTVDVEMPSPEWVGAAGMFPSSERRELFVSIPDRGIRWQAQKTYYWESGDNSLNIGHRAVLHPYQVVPPYPDRRHQPDKNISIRVWYFEYEAGQRERHIYILPRSLVGLDNPEQNGLPEYARTEPDFKTKKPLGCNGCSEMGLPGYTVNMATLRPVFQDTIFAWEGLGPETALRLTWNPGLPAGKTDFGTGWRFFYDAWLTESSEGVTVQRGDGGSSHFSIPTAANRNVSQVVHTERDSVVTISYIGDPGVPAYANDWDGRFEPDAGGYRLKKVLDGDPSLVTFILTPPGIKESYLFQGPSGATGPLPLVAIEDWNDQRLQIVRNSVGAITSITDAAGRRAVLSYNGAGQCSLLTIPGGRSATFGYSGDHLAKTIDLIGNETDYTYDPGRRITTMKTEDRLWRFAWADVEGRTYLESVTDPEGRVTGYSIRVADFESFGTQLTEADGNVITYDFPAGRYRTSSREKMPIVSYDVYGKVKEVFSKGDPFTPLRRFEYHDDGRLSKIIEPGDAEHVYTYNERGLVTSYGDPLGGTWSSEYDARGNLVRRVSPAGREVMYAYDSLGQLIERVDPEGNRVSWTYDTHGNIAAMIDAEGGTTTFGYDPTGINLTGLMDPAGNITEFIYDANRRLTKIIHPDDSFVENRYDGFAQTGFRNENGAWRFVTRSPSLKVLTESDYLGNIRSNQYDPVGRLIRSTDSAGFATHYSYNEQGQPKDVTDAMGRKVSWSYYISTDEFAGHTLSDEPEVTVEVDSDWRGLYRADGRQYVRDSMGRLMSVITPADYWKRITFTRDADGFVLSKNFNNAPVATFSRNLNGQLIESTHSLGTEAYFRNKRGQIVFQTWFDGHSARFDYDLNGRFDSVTYPDASVAAYTYDSRGRITAISWKGQTIRMTYDPAGSLTGEHRSNGHDTLISRDANGSVTGIRHFDSARTLLELNCSRDNRGLIRQCTHSGTLPWAPALSPESTTTEYAYQRSFTITRRQGTPARTDLNGNQTLIPGERGFAGAYDFQNLLIEWNADAIPNEAVYDGKNRLIRWTRNHRIRNFHYDEQDRLLFETDSDGKIAAMWLYRGDQIVAMADDKDLYFYHSDPSANVSYLSDSSGQVVSSYRYMPYGMQAGSFSSVSNPFTFVGVYGVIDLNDGLYYMRSRTYDALTRAFLSNDPLGFGVNVNARSYAGNNPINFIDPDGRMPMSLGSGEMLYPGADGIGSTTPPRKPTLRERRGLRPSSGSSAFDPCVVGTAWNIAGMDAKYGTATGVLQVLDLLRQGEYADAALQAGSVGVGLASSIGGALTTFMAPTPVGETDHDIQAAVEWMKNNKTSKYNGTASEPYSFTIPEFSLDK